MQEILRPHLKTWCEWIVVGVKQGARHALYQYGKAMELFAPDINIAVTVQRELGAPITRARAALSVYDRIEAIDDVEIDARLEELMQERAKKRGKRWVMIDL
jgi:thymidylate kinase